jgi:hypothetical protein
MAATTLKKSSLPKSKKGPHAANHGTVRNRPKTLIIVLAMATCHLSWAINIISLPGFITGYKSALKRRRKFILITLEQ